MSQGMKTCQNCGALLPINATFCGSCGAKITLNDPFQQDVPGVNNAWRSQPMPPYQGHRKKKNNSMKIIVIIVAILVIVLSIIIAVIEVHHYIVSRFDDNILVTDMSTETTSANAVPASKEYAPGIISETTYESSYYNLGFSVPDGYVMLAKDEITQKLEDTETVVWEMFCQNVQNGSAVVVASEELPSRNITMDTYIDAIINNTTGTIISRDKIMTIAGEDYNVIESEFTDEDSGITVNCNQYVRKQDNMAICITTSYAAGNEADEELILSAFSNYADYGNNN